MLIESMGIYLLSVREAGPVPAGPRCFQATLVSPFAEPGNTSVRTSLID